MHFQIFPPTLICHFGVALKEKRERERDASIALCTPFETGSVSSVTVMILDPIMVLQPICFMTSDNTSVFLRSELH